MDLGFVVVDFCYSIFVRIKRILQPSLLFISPKLIAIVLLVLLYGFALDLLACACYY